MNKFKQTYIPIFAGILTSFSLCLNVVFTSNSSIKEMFREEINGIGISELVTLIAIVIFYQKVWYIFLTCSKIITHILSGIFASFMLIGLSYSKLVTWDFIFGNIRQFIIACIFFGGYFLLFDICLSLLYRFCLSNMDKYTAQIKKRVPLFIEQHYAIFAFVFISICWLPYLLFNLPGSVPHDGYRQINMFYNIEPLSNHHPWVLTEFFGFIMELGRTVSDNFGAFLIVLVLFVIEAFCYAIICNKIKAWSASFAFNALVLIFFALLPVFGAYAQAIIKDGIFTAVFSLFFVYYIDLCLAYIRKKEINDFYKKLIILFFIEMCVCLTRNNGFHMIIPADLLLLFFTVKKKRRYILLLSFCVLISYYLVDNKLATYLGVEPGSQREMLSIPFQQTARYLKEYPDDVSDAEEKAINNVLSYSTIAEKYTPEISDPVKSTYKDEATNEELISYFKAWFTMFLKHPDVYFEATFNNTYGYYYPFHNCDALGAYQFYIKGEPIATGEFDIHYIIPKNVQSIIVTYAELWRKIPGLSQLINPATYTWILLIGIGYLCYQKKYKGIVALVAPFLNILVCIASPVNGLLRYSFPLIGCTPIIIYWCLFYKETKSN